MSRLMRDGIAEPVSRDQILRHKRGPFIFPCPADHKQEAAKSGPIPKELGKLTTLTVLHLARNALTGWMPNELGKLHALTILRLGYNELCGPIPNELGKLTALTVLQLCYNHLSGPIPNDLGKLTALTVLHLNSNELSGSIPNILGNLTALTGLHLEGNKLSGPIPNDLGKLTALIVLHLAGNELSGSIPNVLGNLTALTGLHLGDNKLSGSIPNDLGQLTALTDLHLEGNKLSGPIPNELGKLIALTHLRLDGNQLSGLGEGEDARKILDLLSRCKHYLDNNPWECPPAPVVKKGIDAVKKYYDELERAEPVFIDLRKVVFIGHSGAGKTSLIKSIKAGKGQLALEEELESVGVSVQDHTFENGRKGETNVKIYDLAGQVEYYGLHQLFLTERALYVLVWDASKFMVKNKELADYLNEWLETLRLRAPHSTVLLCGTHKDKCVPSNILTKSLAWFRQSRSIQAILKDIEHSIKEKNKQSKNDCLISVEGSKLDCGIQLISSSPICYCENGLADLQKRMNEWGEGTRWLIPPSWRLALVVLDAVRDGIDPIKAARHHKGKDPLPVASSTKLCWVTSEQLQLSWTSVLNSPELNLPLELKPADPDFTLESVIGMRERAGSLRKHPGGVFLDVENFALSLAPILHHKKLHKDSRGASVFADRKLEKQWMLHARTRLVTAGILERDFALFLWKNDAGFPEQTFDELVKLGILLPLLRRNQECIYRPRNGESTASWAHIKEYLVLTRLPLNPTPTTLTLFDSFARLQGEWGVVAKWEFKVGSTPHGLVERLVASCHTIGNVVMDTWWRRGACFVCHEASLDAIGGNFGLALQFTESTTSHIPIAGTLVVQAFGKREGRALWGALRFVISTAWDRLLECPGLRWEGWVECPKHHGRLQHYLACVNDREEMLPGCSIINPRERPNCGCPKGVASRLGTVLPRSSAYGPSPLEDMVKTGDRGMQDAQSFDDGERRFKAALNIALKQS